MSSKHEVEEFLKELKLKVDIFGILFRDDRNKNQQTFYDLEIVPSARIEIIKSLHVEDYVEGPLPEKLHGILPLWIFGKQVKSVETYVKISMGTENSKAICISFHKSEHPLQYQFKKAKL